MFNLQGAKVVLKHYSAKKITDMFGVPEHKSTLKRLEEDNLIPPSHKYRSGPIQMSGWNFTDLPKIGENIGFFKKFSRPVSLSIFTTKGGVLKSTLALNIARTAALHNLKTCVIGLDIQGDVTTALGHENDLEDSGDLRQIIKKLDQTKGLADFFSNQARLNEIIVPTDIENLFLIPETPELVALNDSLNNINRREFWLQEKVVTPLKANFDLIVMDCSPNWNKLTTNALVGCDVLISPLECKINNFRNFKVFRQFLTEFKDEMRIDFDNIFIPTKYSANKKLSMEIRNWYEQNVPKCTKIGVRDSLVGEESVAMNQSMIEFSPNKEPTKEARLLLKEIHQRIVTFLQNRPEVQQKGPKPNIKNSGVGKSQDFHGEIPTQFLNNKNNNQENYFMRC